MKKVLDPALREGLGGDLCPTVDPLLASGWVNYSPSELILSALTTELNQGRIRNLKEVAREIQAL